MDNVVIQLTEPIQAHGETVYSLTIIPPKTKHLKAMDKVEGETAKMITLLEQLASIPASSVEEISAHDMNKLICPVLMDFLGITPETGGK